MAERGSERATIRATLRHRDFRLLMTALGVSTVGSWAYNVALAVWLLDTTGSPGWVAGATVARFAPSLVASAYGGVVAERLERVKLMVTLDWFAAVVMVVLGFEMWADGRPVLVVATAVLTSVSSTVYFPASAAMTPQLVPENELGAANALRNTIDSVCVIAGPGAGALLLLLGDPWVAILANAATFVFSALCLSIMRTRSVPVDVTEGGTVSPLRQMLVGVQTIGTSSVTATLVAFSLLATFVFGTDTVLFVVVSDRLLGTGAAGYGYLLAGMGVGGVLAAGLVARLERRPRLGSLILIGMSGYCLPTLGMLVIHQPAAAFALQVIRGASTLVVDVLAVTALQRSVPAERMARVFGAFDGLMVLAVLLGSLVVPPMLLLVGLNGSLWVMGLGVPALCLLALPRLHSLDNELARRRTELATRVDLLTRADLFAAAGPGALDELAAAATFRDVASGEVVIAEGDPADKFYVVDTGTFTATHLRDRSPVQLSIMGSGDYFGEIGLLEALPRTATVTARTDGRLLVTDGDDFVAALTRQTPSVMLLEGAARRLGRTHPEVHMRRSALRDDGTDDTST
jgi:MFS family permease